MGGVGEAGRRAGGGGILGDVVCLRILYIIGYVVLTVRHYHGFVSLFLRLCLFLSLRVFLAFGVPCTFCKAVLALAQTKADARLSAVNQPDMNVNTNAKAAARSAEDERRRCPDALLVRAVEALGRVYMHREASLVGDVSAAGDKGAVRAGGEGRGVGYGSVIALIFGDLGARRWSRWYKLDGLLMDMAGHAWQMVAILSKD